MEKILIYGDSNVWGDNFITGERIKDTKQWPNILQRSLGKKIKIIQEGLPGRLAGNDEKQKKYKNGQENFLSIFKTSAPINTIIIALGTNDLQIKYNKLSNTIKEDLLWYKKSIELLFSDLDDRKKYFFNETMPRIIYILPINFDYKNNAKEVFNENSEIERRKLHQIFIEKVGCETIITEELPLFKDGVHLNIEGHKKMASIVERIILENE